MSAAEIAAIVTPVIIAAGFIFAYRQWASYRNARMAQIILSITERWDSPEMKQSRCRIAKSGVNLRHDIEGADAKNADDLCELVMVANFFDAVGLMVVEGFLDCSISYKLFGRAEEHYHEAYRSLLEDARYKDYFRYFGRLHKAFKSEATKESKEEKPHRRP